MLELGKLLDDIEQYGHSKQQPYGNLSSWFCGNGMF